MAGRQEFLLRAIAECCERLSRLYTEGSSLTDPMLVQLSQQLDALIVEWHHLPEEPEDADDAQPSIRR